MSTHNTHDTHDTDRHDTPQLIVFNAGSSSLKFQMFTAGPASESDAGTPASGGATYAGPAAGAAGAVSHVGKSNAQLEFDGERIAVPEARDHATAARLVLARLLEDEARGTRARVVATGHRVVHGGERFHAPTVIDEDVLRSLEQVAALAPLHVPPALAVMAETRQALPDAQAVAVFDTAFFHSLPQVALRYAVPDAWRQRYGIRRYGFHGLAHEEMSRALAVAGAGPRVVTLLLGQGCSAAAVRDGRPIDTSMGFTPLEGLVMGTRCGDLDAGVVLHLARAGVDAATLDESLNRRSGLLGVSGSSDDVRELLEREDQGDPAAALALEMFVYRVRKYIGAYAAALGGLDAVAFGGGIGENSSIVRERILTGLEWLGVTLDPAANACAIGVSADIAAAGSPVAVRVVAIDEQRSMANAVMAHLTHR